MIPLMSEKIKLVDDIVLTSQFLFMTVKWVNINFSVLKLLYLGLFRVLLFFLYYSVILASQIYTQTKLTISNDFYIAY